MDNSRGPSLSTHWILHVLRHIFLGRLCLHCFKSVPVALNLLAPPLLRIIITCGPLMTKWRVYWLCYVQKASLFKSSVEPTAYQITALFIRAIWSFEALEVIISSTISTRALLATAFNLAHLLHLANAQIIASYIHYREIHVLIFYEFLLLHDMSINKAIRLLQSASSIRYTKY